MPRADVPNGVSPFMPEMAGTIGVDVGCTHSGCFAFEAGRPFLFGVVGDYINCPQLISLLFSLSLLPHISSRLTCLKRQFDNTNNTKMKAYEMAVLPGRWSMEMGPPTPQPTDEICAAPETNLTSHCGASRRAATPRFADIRTPVIPPGYQQIPGYEAHRRRQEIRALMGSIAERRGKPTLAPILIYGDAPSLLSRGRRW